MSFERHLGIDWWQCGPAMEFCKSFTVLYYVLTQLGFVLDILAWSPDTHTHTHTHTLTDPTEIVDGTKNSKKKKKKEKTKTTIRGLSAPGRPLRSLWPTGRRWRTGTTVFWRAGSWSCCRIWRHLAGAIRTAMSPERHQRRPASYLRVYCSLQTISPSCLHKWVSIRSLGRISMCFLSFL